MPSPLRYYEKIEEADGDDRTQQNAQTPDNGKDLHRFIHGIDPDQSGDRALKIAVHAVKETGGPGLGISPDHYMADRETPFPGLDQGLQGIGEILNHDEAEGFISVISPEAAGRVWDGRVG